MISRYVVVNNKNIAIEVIEVDENINKDSIVPVSEILKEFFPNETIVKETKYTNLAGKEYIYFNNQFFMPKPFDSWTWNGKDWEAPERYPSNGKTNFWNEEMKKWEILLEDV